MRPPAALAAAALAALAGCGLPDDREPHVITAEEAPLDLARTVVGPSSTGPAEVVVYFVREGRLVEVTRDVEAATVSAAITAVLARPTPEEAAANVRSEIPPETELRSATVADGVATIDLGCTVGDGPSGTLPSNCGVQGTEGTAQLTLFAQLVCTADALPGVDGVLFLQEGTPQAAPVDGGLSTGAQPVRCSDYLSVQR